MIKEIILDVPADIHLDIHRHLLDQQSELEQAAFAYAQPKSNEGVDVFAIIAWQPVPPEGFVYQSEIGFELTDEMRGIVIKRAHDLKASLIEFHSHTGSWPAKFSPSDRYGFLEFVPHVWWRLKGRPYFSLVFARSGFDAFAWIADPTVPERLGALVVEGQHFTPTMLSPITLDDFDYD